MSRMLRTCSHQALLITSMQRDIPLNTTFTKLNGEINVPNSNPFTLPPPIEPLSSSTSLTAGFMPSSIPAYDPTQISVSKPPPSAWSPTSFGPAYSYPSSSSSSINPYVHPFLFDTSHSLSTTPSCTLHTNCHSGTHLLSNFGLPLQRSASLMESIDPPNANKYNHDSNHPKDENELPLDIFDQPTGDTGPVSDPASATAVLHPNLKDLIDKEQTFLVNFNLWQPQVPEEPTEKRKKTPGGPRGNTHKSTAPKYANFNPKIPTRVTVQPKTILFTSLKRLFFSSCNSSLPGVDKVLHSNKVTITNPANFCEFVIASLTASTHTVMVFKIIHENPLKTSHAKHSLAWFLREPADNGKDKSDISNGEESVGSEGPQKTKS
ncbi:hypothetical protein DFH28DRAFT_1176468 [Melampsora americana]|nr:hypothetical protein DFH28DRAFT_1176468 [Melampsora americana]